MTHYEIGDIFSMSPPEDKMENIETTLEAMIDKHGLTHVVNTLAVLCAEKAEHIQTNWQDKTTARVWDLDFKTLDKAARNIMSDGI